MNYKNVIGIEVLPKPDDFKAAQQAVSYLTKLEEKIILNKG
jgi:hypothetical protein